MKASNSQILLVMSIFHRINLPAGFLSVSQAYLYQLPLLQQRQRPIVGAESICTHS